MKRKSRKARIKIPPVEEWLKELVEVLEDNFEYTFRVFSLHAKHLEQTEHNI